MSHVLEIENLTVRYDAGAEALRGVCLSVGPGRRVGLIGPNGAGKTTLLLAIMRGVRASGSIVVDGVELTRRTVDQVRSRCGMTFQSADDQLFMATLLDDVAFGPLNQGKGPQEAESLARHALRAVALDGLETRSAHHLSGGQKQNAALATILAMQVKILLLDEPGASLDLRSRRRLMAVLAQRPEAMIIATHDLDVIRTLCTRVVVLDEGRIVADGDVETILGDTDLLAAHGLA